MGALLTFVVMFSTQDVLWSRVEQLPRGADLRVVVDSGASYRGDLSSADESSIHLVVNRRSVRVERAHIRRVSLNQGTHHKRRNVFLGFLLGGITGAAAHQAGCGDQGAACAESSPAAFYPGAAAGAILAALVPSGDWKMIYIKG